LNNLIANQSSNGLSTYLGPNGQPFWANFAGPAGQDKLAKVFDDFKLRHSNFEVKGSVFVNQAGPPGSDWKHLRRRRDLDGQRRHRAARQR
jgi:hypothetical protein